MFDGRLEDMISDLQRILEEYPTGVIRVESVSAEDEWEGYGHYLKIYKEQLETDEQYASRKAAEAALQSRQLERDREQYEALRKRFDPNV